MPTPPPGQAAQRGMRAIIARTLPPDSRAGRGARRAAVALEDAVRSIAAPLHLTRDAVRMAQAWRQQGPGIGAAPTGRTIIMLVVSQVHIDPRVRQEAQALAAAGYTIIVIWPELPAQIGRPIDWGTGISFQPLAPAAGHFAYRYPGFLGADMLAAALAHRPFAFHAHDLTTAQVALIAARRTGAHAVCDFHEWFSEHVTWSSRRQAYVPLARRQRVANKWLERLVFTDASAVVTVCESIALDMERDYGDGSERIHVVRNIAAPTASATRTYPSLRDELALRGDEFLVLYQGGVGPSRALEPVITALAAVPGCVLAIRGPSIADYAAHYRAVATASGVASHQLVLLEPVPATDVVAACHGADAGLYTVADLCKSFRYALPNKVFEYMMAGLPILTADYPEVRTAVVQTGAGLPFDPVQPASIAAAIRAMMDVGRRADIRARLPAVLARLDAGAEWLKLVALYRALETGGPITAIGRNSGRQRPPAAWLAP